MNELGRLLVVEIVKSKFHQIKKNNNKKKMDLVVKKSPNREREIYIIFILCVKELWKNFGREKFRMAKISDG